MKKWNDAFLVKCFAGKLGNDFIKEDEDVAEARLAFLEKNKRYIKYTLSILFFVSSSCRVMCLSVCLPACHSISQSVSLLVYLSVCLTAFAVCLCDAV